MRLTLLLIFLSFSAFANEPVLLTLRASYNMPELKKCKVCKGRGYTQHDQRNKLEKIRIACKSCKGCAVLLTLGKEKTAVIKLDVPQTEQNMFILEGKTDFAQSCMRAFKNEAARAVNDYVTLLISYNLAKNAYTNLKTNLKTNGFHISGTQPQDSGRLLHKQSCPLYYSFSSTPVNLTISKNFLVAFANKKAQAQAIKDLRSDGTAAYKYLKETLAQNLAVIPKLDSLNVGAIGTLENIYIEQRTGQDTARAYIRINGTRKHVMFKSPALVNIADKTNLKIADNKLFKITGTSTYQTALGPKTIYTLEPLEMTAPKQSAKVDQTKL